MTRIMLKSKIYNAAVTETELYYKGSITIDGKILQAADLKEGERVDVLNLNTGVRLQTYVIRGESGSGIMCLNGPAARSAFKGDKIIIVSYAMYDDREIAGYKAVYVQVDDNNNIKNIS